MSDTIERSEAMKHLKQWFHSKGQMVSDEDCKSILWDIPSADRPQGEWIVSCKDSICSVCGKDEAEFICGTEDWYGYGLSNYCPNCGARMKGADDEDV